jgi:hypothetical protein
VGSSPVVGNVALNFGSPEFDDLDSRLFFRYDLAENIFVT